MLSPGWGNAGRCAVKLYVGEGPRGSNGACSTLHWISITPSATHNQMGPLGCWFLSGWACAHSRPLWVSPTTSPVKLGVSPAAAPTPTGIFNQRSEALFPRAGALGYAVCLVPDVRPVYLCANVGLQGLLVVRLPAPFISHSASLSPAMATRVLSAQAARLRPSYQSGWMFFFFYFLGVWLPCSWIFHQFWLCEEAQCVYLRSHLGSPRLFFKHLDMSSKKQSSWHMHCIYTAYARDLIINHETWKGKATAWDQPLLSLSCFAL